MTLSHSEPGQAESSEEKVNRLVRDLSDDEAAEISQILETSSFNGKIEATPPVTALIIGILQMEFSEEEVSTALEERAVYSERPKRPSNVDSDVGLSLIDDIERSFGEMPVTDLDVQKIVKGERDRLTDVGEVSIE